MKGYRKYFAEKLVWFLITFDLRIPFEFHPAPPDAGRSRGCHHPKSCPGHDQSERGCKSLCSSTQSCLVLNKPMLEQFFIYIKNVFQGNLGVSFSQYPRPVSDIISASIWWTVALQFPAIIVGWMIGNTLGALAAYLKKGFDKVIMPVSIFVSNLPAFGMAIILLVIFGIQLKWFPTSGGYGFDMIPNFSWHLYGL